jgi:oligopeptidase A
MSNPLIDYPGLPPFSQIDASQAETAVDTLIASGKKVINEVLAAGDFSWASLVARLDREEERLSKAFGPIGHLNAVAQTDAMRTVYNACLPKLSAYGSEVGQNADLYRVYQALKDSPEFSQLDEAQRRDLEDTLRDFVLSGVALSDDKKRQFRDNSIALSGLTSRYADNVLDATQAWTKHITSADELEGVPSSALAAAAERAQEKHLEGWILTLDSPCYLAVLAHGKNRELREEMYRAHVTRASETGPNAGAFDNGQIMSDILRLRHEQAQLLGFSSYAEKSLATKMAPSVDKVFEFLRDLAKRSKPQAQQELKELRIFAAEQGAGELKPWDMTFWSQRLQEARYDFNEEELRPWFPLERVLEGLFTIVGRLYGIRFQPRDDVDTWHRDVRYVELRDKHDAPFAGFYLDPYARTGKRGGAWMDDCLVRTRRIDGSLQKPVAYLVCNFAPPASGQPGLLTHDEVVTLFHEFGHGLHHLLTEQEVSGVSGINGVEWDAVELPSQFMENWCWQEESLALISGHFETGEPLPRDKLDRMLAARNFQSGLAMLRQLEFSLFDFEIHANYHKGLDIQQCLDRVRDEVAVIKAPDFNRFQHGFGHIFAGGYAAGYYSYKWAEVLSADAFSRFEEEGIFNAETGASFRREILSRGGSRDAMTSFKAFRGREPSVEPLLRHCGIAA